MSRGWTAAKRRSALAATFAGLGFTFAWIATSARYLALINWDNAAYLSAYGVGKLNWSTPPWDAHFAIGNLYLLGVWAAHGLGGTSIDGFRLVDALAYGCSAAVLVDACAAALEDRRLAALITLAWMTAWVNTFLLFTLEDNVLYFPAAILILWLSVKHLHAWRPAVSLKVGAWLGGAILLSWQSMLYAGPACYAALIGGPRRRPFNRRLIAALLVFAGALATMVGWCSWIAATSKLSWMTLLAAMFHRPNTLGALNGSLTHGAGTALAFALLAHSAYHLALRPAMVTLLGSLVFTVEVAIYLASIWWGRRFRDWRPHLLAASLLLLSIAISIYHDVDYAYLKRFDFLPIHLALLGAVTLTRLPERGRRWVAVALAFLVVAQVAHALKWDRLQHARYASQRSYAHLPHPEAAWYGRDGQSFYAYFRALREASPGACRHVFSITEIWEGEWQFDQVASLYSELPDYLVLGNPRIVQHWRAPPRIMSVKSFLGHGLDQPCTWYSNDARLLLGRRAR